MVKYFCDGCKNELTATNQCNGGPINCKSRLGTTLKRNGVTIGIEIITSMDGTTNEGMFCKYCVLDAVAKLDDRPKCR